MLLNTGLYGLTNYAIINALCTGLSSNVVFISSPAEKALNHALATEDLGDVLLGFDNEVVIDTMLDSLRNCRMKLMTYLSDLIKKMEKIFGEDENIYFASKCLYMPNILYEFSVDEMLTPLLGETLLHTRFIEWLYPKVKAWPLKMSDFRATLTDLRKNISDISLQTHDPFIIERRRMLALSLNKALGDFKTPMNQIVAILAKCMFPECIEQAKSDKKSLLSSSEFDGCRIRLNYKILNDPMLDEVICLSQKIRDDSDWIDPSVLIMKIDDYKPLLMSNLF